MDRITLHRADADNAGLFCDAGTTLAIGPDAKPGFITAERADALVEVSGAVDGLSTPLSPVPSTVDTNAVSEAPASERADPAAGVTLNAGTVAGQVIGGETADVDHDA